MLSEVFGISRQAYYKRQNRVQKNIKEKEIVLQLIKPLRKRMYRIGTIKLYGKLKKDLNKKNIKMGRDKLFDLLRDENMLVHKKKNFTKTTNSFHRFHKHKNLIKDLEVIRPEEVWVSDITYIKTDAGHEYLSVITDYYSKRIVGYNLADTKPLTRQSK
jgi:transposase InsO family protein